MSRRCMPPTSRATPSMHSMRRRGRLRGKATNSLHRWTITMTTIDLNSDLGEGFGIWSLGDDAAMLDIVSSANVACGFHGGDSDIMLSISKLAKTKGVSIGAHPGYRDLHGFGRRPVPGITSSEIETMVAYQIGALQAVATMAGHRVTHVKVHGALSNVACVDPMT